MANRVILMNLTCDFNLISQQFGVSSCDLGFGISNHLRLAIGGLLRLAFPRSKLQRQIFESGGILGEKSGEEKGETLCENFWTFSHFVCCAE